MKNQAPYISIIQYLESQRGFDFYGLNPAMISRGVDLRCSECNTGTNEKYFDFLRTHPEESDLLTQALTINVSSFFRDPLVFNYLSSIVLPTLIMEKSRQENTQLRIWSAACAAGEESYSLAILFKELIKKEYALFDLDIFATDIDTKSINLAKKAVYSKQSLKSIPFGHLKHFTPKGEKFYLDDKIKHMVTFSKYDLLDKKNFAPPECIFADFDIILCRNVLIYYKQNLQEKILNKLYRSLNPMGYLVLGEAEKPSEKYRNYFKKVTDCCNIYQKIEER